jgi:hypothetical protein
VKCVGLGACPCYALIEGRASLEPAGESIPLTDPAPPALEHLAAGWNLSLSPAPPLRRARPAAHTRPAGGS